MAPVFGVFSDASYRIVVHWEHDDDAVGYLVEWRLATALVWEQQQEPANPNDPDAIINGLTPRTDYAVRLTAQFADGSVDVSLPAFVRTLATPPPSPRQTPGTGVMYGVDATSDSLYTVNLTTGAWTLVGDTEGIPSCSNRVQP